MADPQERGQIQIARDSNLYNQRILRQRIEDSRYPGGTPREDAHRELMRREVHQNLPEMNNLSKFAAIATGVAIFGRGVSPRSLVKGLSHIGSVGSFVKNRVIEPARGMIDDAILGMDPYSKAIAREFAGATRAGGTMANPDLVTDLDKIFGLYASTGTQAMRWLHGPNKTGIDIYRKDLFSRFNGRRVTRSGLEGLRVADIANNAALQKGLSSQAKQTLRQGLSLGIITGDTHLSLPGIGGLFRDVRTNNVLDSQWIQPKRLFDNLHKGLRTVGLFGIKPADIVFGTVRPLLFEGRYQTIGNNVTLPNGGKTGKLLSFNVGGDVYSQVFGKAEFSRVMRGAKVYDTSSPGTHFWARAIAAAQGKLEKQVNAGIRTRRPGRSQSLFGHYSNRIQEVTGVGHQFQTNRSIFTEIYDFFARRRYGDFVPNEAMPRQSRMSVIQKTIATAEGRVIAKHRGVRSDTFIEAYMNEAVPSNIKGVRDLSFIERLKAYANNNKAGRFYLRRPSKDHPGIGIGDPLNPRRPMMGYTPAGPLDPISVGPEGGFSSLKQASGVVDLPGGMRTFNVTMHHMTERLNQLLGASAGIGIRPTGGEWGWMANVAKLYGLASAANMGLESAKYVDYLAGEALDFIPGLNNKTPSQYAVSLYTSTMVGRQHLRQKLGIQQGASYLEGLMPGSMSLPGSYLARTVLPVAVGAYRAGRGGAALGGMLSTLIGGSDPGMTPQELSSIYSGDKKIPIMKSRWWVLGLQPWGGSEISHYQHHWTARYQADPRYTSTQFGSKGEYFSYQSPLPTPHNWFGLRKILNPDHYAEKHKLNRPYPFAPSGAAMHSGESLILPASLESYQTSALGLTPSPTSYTLGRDPSSLGSKLNRGIEQITEIGGIYKFIAEQLPFYNDVFGADKARDLYAANAETITSGSRMFYDENLGGGLGMTELLRRLLDYDEGAQGINFIPNTMPEWLPGARSIYPKDQNYYNDFTLGDPYARIQQGEIRLPGAAYESLHRLHSGTPGIYDAMDRYLILADVAPYSQAYREHKAIVEGWISSGVIDQYWKKKFSESERQVTSRLDGPEFTPRIFSGMRSGTPEQLARVNEYNAVERTIGSLWETLTHDVVPSFGKTIPLVGTILDRKLLGQRSALESYMEDKVYGSDFHNWSTPYESFIEPRLRKLTASDPITASAGGLGLGMFFGPTPMGLAASAIGALSLGATSTVRMMSTGQSQGGWRPGDFTERNELEQYFDALQFEKYTRLATMARFNGNDQLASDFKRKADYTSIGMPYNSTDEEYLASARFRLGNDMKDYAWQFLQAPHETREMIMSIAPDMARPVLAGAWSRTGDRRYRRSPSGPNRERALEVIRQFGMPNSDWTGWHPDIPLNAIKLRTLDSYNNIAYDMHKHNLWRHDRVSLERDYPTLRPAF